MSLQITTTQEASEAALHLLATKYYAVAAQAMITYDIALTIPLEIEKIWQQKFSGLAVLWTLNRWWFYFVTWVTLLGYLDPSWSLTSCDNYFLFIGVTASLERLIVGIIFSIRIYCIYGRSKLVTLLPVACVAAEFTVKMRSVFVYGEPVLLPQGLTGCVLSVAPQNSFKFLGFWITELVTDFTVMALTAYRTYDAYWKMRVFKNHPLWDVIIKDGLMYFLLMVSTNLTSIIFYVTFPSDLKSINATFGSVLTSVLTSRLILNLKVAGARGVGSGQVQTTSYLSVQTQFEARIIGNMANKMEGLDSAETYEDSRRHQMELRVLRREKAGY